MLMRVCVLGASFNNLLDALDGSYCTFEGGDDGTQDGVYPDPQSGGYKGAFPMFFRHFLSMC
jgi:tripeptidyl-peptidase-1